MSFCKTNTWKPVTWNLLDAKVMLRMMWDRWEFLTGDKEQRIGMDGGEQLGRFLSFMDSAATQ